MSSKCEPKDVPNTSPLFSRISYLPTLQDRQGALEDTSNIYVNVGWRKGYQRFMTIKDAYQRAVETMDIEKQNDADNSSQTSNKSWWSTLSLVIETITDEIMH